MAVSNAFLEAMEAYNAEHSDVARRLMEECAHQGDPTACFTMVLWCAEGEGGPIEIDKAEKWWVRLEDIANAGNAQAQWILSNCYRFGNLVDADFARANSWLESAANNGFGEAQHLLAYYKECGAFGYQESPKEAEAWYQRAFEQEDPETLYLFAIRRFKDGRPTDEAIELLKRAASKGLGVASEALERYGY